MTPRKTLESGGEAPFFVIIETTGSNKDHDDEVSKKTLSLAVIVLPTI